MTPLGLTDQQLKTVRHRHERDKSLLCGKKLSLSFGIFFIFRDDAVVRMP